MQDDREWKSKDFRESTSLDTTLDLNQKGQEAIYQFRDMAGKIQI